MSIISDDNAVHHALVKFVTHLILPRRPVKLKVCYRRGITVPPSNNEGHEHKIKRLYLKEEKKGKEKYKKTPGRFYPLCL